MEILSNLLQAIDIQQKRQDDDFREMMSKPLKEQVDKGHTLVNLFITGINFFEDQPNNYCPQIGSNQRFVNRIYIHCTNNCSKFREGTPVVLINGPYKLHMDIESDGIDDFILHSNDYDVKYNFMNFINYPMENWMINSVNLSITANLLRSTWQRLNNEPQILQRVQNILNGNLINTFNSKSYLLTDDASQNKAIQKALGCSDFCIIQGPPGTGKTYTIAKITATLVDEGKKVFITGPTHTAINNCLNSISKEISDRTKVVKIGEKYQASEISNNPYILRKSRLPFSKYKTDNDFSQRGFVVGATPYALCFPASKKLEGWIFDYVIIDEAAQMSIPLALSAMIYGTKLVFVGDHKQLDPIIPQHTGNHLFDSSIFKKMVDLYDSQVSLLDYSYRLNEKLIRIPNILFYDRQIHSKCGTNTEYIRFKCKNYPEIINNPSNEILYVHHYFDSLGRSPFEAEVAAKIVSDLSSNGVDFKRIGLMSPYRAQIREIKRAIVDNNVLKEDCLDELFIDTVDCMQGQEKDYIIFSLSNSNPEEVVDRLEFFYSPNRLNVAITRARIKCIVISNEKVFKICAERMGKSGNSKDLNDGMRAFNDFYKFSTKMENKYDDEW